MITFPRGPNTTFRNLHNTFRNLHNLLKTKVFFTPKGLDPEAQGKRSAALGNRSTKSEPRRGSTSPGRGGRPVGLYNPFGVGIYNGPRPRVPRRFAPRRSTLGFGIQPFQGCPLPPELA